MDTLDSDEVRTCFHECLDEWVMHGCALPHLSSLNTNRFQTFCKCQRLCHFIPLGFVQEYGEKIIWTRNDDYMWFKTVRDVGVPGVPYLDSLRQHDMKRMPFTLPPSNVPGLDVRFHQPLAATQGAATPERRGMHPMKWGGLMANWIAAEYLFHFENMKIEFIGCFQVTYQLETPWNCWVGLPRRGKRQLGQLGRPKTGY